MTVKPPDPPPLPSELDRLLRRMRLPYIRKAAPEVIATANAQRWDHAEVLRVLLAEEVKGRGQATTRMRRRASGLPAGKTFDAWEEKASAIPKQTQQALRTLEWVDRAEALCVCGPSGTGKSHLIEALGHLAIDRGKTVAWHTLETLAQLFRRHRADDSINKAISKLTRSQLILIDDVGLLPVSPEAAEALFRVVDAAYEKRSIAISSNIHPSGFDELMPKTPGHRDRRPPPAPRARDHHRRPRQLPTRASDRRQGAKAPALTARRNPRGGEKRWPPVGRKHGRGWGENMAVLGEKQMAIDNRSIPSVRLRRVWGVSSA
jgi:DNA replication protein DnaC